MRTTRSLLSIAVPWVLVSCGSITAVGGGPPDAGGAILADAGPDASAGIDGASAIEGGTGDAGACAIDPPGAAFTFHVHNAGSRDLGLAYGCGGNQPIVLSTPAGSLGIGPESANECGFTCAQDYKGNPQEGCSDCGGGTGADLGVGAVVDITWDRRVYITQTADPSCVGGQDSVSCALAVAVSPTPAQQGTLTVCTSGSSSGGPGGGYCGASQAVPFTVDLTQSAATIDVD